MSKADLHVSHRIQAPAAELWRAWTDPQRLCGWDPDRVDGELARGQEIVMHWDSFGVSLQVEIIELVFERELGLRVRRPDGAQQELWVSLEQLDAQSTEITLVFKGPMNADERAGTAAGWHTQLRLLDRFLRLPELPRHSFAALGPAICSPDRVYEEFVEPVFWLAADAPRFAKEGQSVSMHTPEGETIRGEVLSLVPGRELALWCEDLSGVVRMRAIPLAGGRARLVGIQVVRWGQAPRAHPIQESLRLSVDRLIARVGGPSGRA